MNSVGCSARAGSIMYVHMVSLLGLLVMSSGLRLGTATCSSCCVITFSTRSTHQAPLGSIWHTSYRLSIKLECRPVSSTITVLTCLPFHFSIFCSSPSPCMSAYHSSSACFKHQIYNFPCCRWMQGPMRMWPYTHEMNNPS